MKKFKSLALVLVSLISLASCSSSNNEKKLVLPMLIGPKALP